MFQVMILPSRSYLFLIILQSLQVIGKDCPYGWFGIGCKYMCHCAKNVPCNARGECSRDARCAREYFGPGCQYVDLFARYALSSERPFLFDDDDTTCNPFRFANTLKIILSKRSSVSWYRIIVQDNRNIGLQSFSTFFNDVDICVNQRKYKHNTDTVDITCDRRVIFKSLTVVGPVARMICTMYISGGNNVALREMTNQTSTATLISKQYGSNKAVDGNTYSYFQMDSCTMTDFKTIEPEWWLTLARPARLYSVVIYNRSNYKARLNGFTMSLITETLAIEYTYTWNSTLDIYDIDVITDTHIKYIKIKKTNSKNRGYDNVLTLCEVQAFGYTVCSNDTYGFMCDEHCSCAENEACNVITGQCAPMCRPGKYGDKCQHNCGANCLYRICSYRTGHCIKCLPGYMGDYCNEICPPGTFGTSCKLNCSNGCADICEATSGICRCKDGFSGRACFGCVSGLFGVNCDMKCSVGCADACNPVTGHCTCRPAYSGLMCTDCRPGFQTADCKFNCSKGCQYTCNNTNGYCRCREGYTGPLCSECTPGMFGPDCEFFCSEGCTNTTCNSTNGHCTCHTGYGGLQCLECEPESFGSHCELTCPRGCPNNCNRPDRRCFECSNGWYAEYCDMFCSEFCYGRVCNMSTGECLSCFGKRQGFYCSECRNSYYGLRCESKCPDSCINSTCDHISGKCPKCRKGFTGDMCLQVVEKPSPWIAPMTFMPFLILLFVCLPGGNDEDDVDEDSSSSDWSDDDYSINNSTNYNSHNISINDGNNHVHAY